MNQKLLRKKLALMLANLRKKRPYYCEVEYLEADGTQYIDTGDIQAGIGLKVDTVAEKTSSATSEMAIIGRSSGGGFELYAYNNRIGLWNTAGANSIDVNTSMTQNEKFHFIGEVKNNSLSLSINGSETTKTAITAEGTDPLTATITLFRHNGRYNFIGKIYYCKIWSNNTLVCDLIPVLDWNYVPCMYDKVTGQLLYNAGTGDFTYGREIHYVEYLEGTGTQHIDVPYIPKDTSGLRAVWCYSDEGDRVIAGARWSTMSSGRWFIGHYSSGLYFGWNSLVATIVTTADTFYDCKLNMYNDRKVYLDGVEQATISTTLDTTSMAAMKLFFVDHAGAKAIGKLKLCQVTEGDKLIYDFVPAIDENGVGFMFDKVTHTCFLNVGTGAFKYPARQLVYLKSTGTEYIDTGTKFDCANTTIEVKTNETSLTQVHSICGNDGNVFYLFRGTGNWAVGYNATDFNIQDYVVLGDNTFKIDKNLVYVNGDLVKTYTASTTLSTSNTLIFNRKTSLVDSGPVTIYYCKIWNNNEVVRYLIPCFKDGVAGMLDKANNVFYSNVGSGTFTVGKIVEPKYER